MLGEERCILKQDNLFDFYFLIYNKITLNIRFPFNVKNSIRPFVESYKRHLPFVRHIQIFIY